MAVQLWIIIMTGNLTWFDSMEMEIPVDGWMTRRLHWEFLQNYRIIATRKKRVSLQDGIQSLMEAVHLMATVRQSKILHQSMGPS